MQAFVQINSGELRLFGSYIVPIQLTLLVILLVIAAIIDMRERRIPNWLVAMGMIMATAFHALGWHGAGISFALLGLITGMAILFPLHLLRAMGAGDVKLMGMVGAFLGTTGVTGAVLATMAAGGVLAIGMTACKRMLPQLLDNLRSMFIQHQIRQMGGGLADPLPAPPSVGKMPYALAILAGTLLQLVVLRY